jgi:hypothetical protein
MIRLCVWCVYVAVSKLSPGTWASLPFESLFLLYFAFVIGIHYFS